MQPAPITQLFPMLAPFSIMTLDAIQQWLPIVIGAVASSGLTPLSAVYL